MRWSGGALAPVRGILGIGGDACLRSSEGKRRASSRGRLGDESAVKVVMWLLLLLGLLTEVMMTGGSDAAGAGVGDGAT